MSIPPLYPHAGDPVGPHYLSFDLSRRTANQYLTEVSPLAKAEHVVSALMPSRRIAKFLKMKNDEPCFLLHRRTWTQGMVASTADLYHPGSRYDPVGRIKP